MDKGQFLKRVQEYAHINARERAEELCKVVFHLLSARLTENESRDLMSQLPSGIKEMWEEVEEKGVIKFHKDEFLERIMMDGRLESILMAEVVANTVFKVLKEQITKGEADDVAAQLPRHLKEMWLSA
ncbi:MAG: DUF2267 domain-containing protein [Candidatus Dadabacteria bacterium]|jgi:uncharacterized protein (DUF2267 family)|nr:DUF2267 domain-containing protein [Candidatus Dadabacteria bacterium]